MSHTPRRLSLSSAIPTAIETLGHEGGDVVQATPQELKPTLALGNLASAPTSHSRRTDASPRMSSAVLNDRALLQAPPSSTLWTQVLARISPDPFARSMLSRTYEIASDWMVDGAPAQHDPATRVALDMMRKFEKLVARDCFTGRPPRDVVKRNMALIRTAKDFQDHLNTLGGEMLSAGQAMIDTTLIHASNFVLPEEFKKATKIFDEYEKSPRSQPVDDQLAKVMHQALSLLKIIARTRAFHIEQGLTTNIEDTSTNERVSAVSEGLTLLADYEAMIRLLDRFRVQPLTLARKDQFTLADVYESCFTMAVTLDHLQRFSESSPTNSEALDAAKIRDLTAGLLQKSRERQRPNGSQAEMIGEADRWVVTIAGWHDLRRRTTAAVVSEFTGVIKSGCASWRDREAFISEHENVDKVRRSLEFCSDALPVMANALRQLRDELEFEWSSSVERTAEERESLKFLVAHLEHEEFMTRATAALADPWIDKATGKQLPVEEAITMSGMTVTGAAAATTRVAALSNGVAPTEPNAATAKAARPPDMSKAQWGKLKKKLEREALEAQKQRAKVERENRKAARAEGTPVNRLPAAVANSTTSAATADIATNALPGSMRSDAGSVTTVRLPSRTLADLKAGTTDLDHSEFLMKRWSGIREALDQAEIHCHARYCSAREFREIEGAEAATTRAREALGRAQADLRDADLVLAQSPHREQLKAEHRPHAAKHSDLNAKVRAMEARVAAVAAAKPLLTAQEFIDQWLSGGFELSPVRGDTRIAHDTRGRPLCKILARPTQDLGGYSQQHMQIHFHMDRRSTAEYGHQVRAGDLLMVDGCPIVSVKLASHEYNTGPGYFRLWFSSEQIRHLTNMLLRAFPTASNGARTSAR